MATSRTRDQLSFRHERIDDAPPCDRIGICQTTDLTGNGRPDLIVGGLGHNPSFSLLGKTFVPREIGFLNDLYARREESLVWYENPGWERHTLAREPDLHLDVGSALVDLTGNGRLDLLVGQGYTRSKVFWYEQPADPREPWTQHVLTDRFQLYHDLAVGDVDDDGDPEVVGLSQEAETVFYYDVPDDPRRSPWPDDHCHVVDEGRWLEGVAVVDVDGDGRTELLAGTSVYHRNDDGTWEREDVLTGWDDVRIAVADLDGDGDPEVVYAEGDSPTYGSHPGRVAWVDPPEWDVHVLRDDMFCPHSLDVGDVTGNGYPDVYVGEMGLGENDDPEHLLFVNDGAAFTETVIARGVPTHEAKLVDVDGDGRLDVLGKSYHPDPTVDVWYND